MSRSTKRPFITDQQSNSKSKVSRSVWAKRQANKAVRAANKKALEDAAEELADGKQYRKASNSWDIRDWSMHSPKDKKAYRK